MNYTINQLRIFLKVSQTKSITKASEELHLTQPAVSIQLKNFQEQFKIPLTETIGRQIFITDFGKEIAAATENILNQLNEINFKTLEHQGKLTGRLKFSVVSTGKYIMPYFISGFINDHEGIELVMDVTNKNKVIESLENNEVDFSLVSVLPDKLLIEKIELLQNKLFVISNKKHELKKKVYTKNILETLPIIYREKGSGTRNTMEKFLIKNKIVVRKKMELTSNEAVKQAVIAGLGCSIMPLIGIKNELQNGDMQIIPTKGFPIESVWYLIWLKGKKHSPVASSYLSFLEREKLAIVKNNFDWYEKY
ncbi:MAG: LysR family transcriptional regulator [Crocinitomicaceae bacterium]|nr:LysR family transcriptional regulator [Crocinitomicaceae bacterium]MCF8411386.1 LysR family transcriptional regulator [Crocinitomicaceae bacterium]MCF8443611.1 LysR family transcriptional regulator [Crocinitomicaceae bacterium]